ncbi:MAG: HPr-rel-A system PqqD family peptide chaperone [Pseudomonadota bacterium]
MEWCAASGALEFLAWEDTDEAVVYHRPSGDTHLLPPLQAQLLLALQAAPASSEAMYRALEDTIAEEDRPRAMDYIEASLLQLRDLHLVSSLSS